MSVEKYGSAIEKSIFTKTNQDFTFSHIRENSKILDSKKKLKGKSLKTLL